MKAQMKKWIKVVLIILLISILLEVLLLGYNVIIKKLYSVKHLIDNEPVSLHIEDFVVSEPDEYGYVYLQYNQEIANLYNVEMTMKETSEDKYIRLLYNNDSTLMLKSNKEQTKFKAYINQTNVSNLQISFQEGTINTEDIESITLNANIDYLPENAFSGMHVVIFFIILMLGYLIVKYGKNSLKFVNKIKKENLFLIIGAILGIILCFVNLPLRKYDEHAHFWKAYEVSMGNFTSNPNKGTIPKTIYSTVIDENGLYHIENNTYSYQEVLETIDEGINPEDGTYINPGTVSNLSPFSYLPQAIGILIARIMHLSPTLIAIAGRMTNLIAYLLCMYFAIKLMPKEKWKNILIVVALLPMSLVIGASLSPDAVIISVLTLAIAYLLNLKYVKDKITIKNIIILAILFMIPAICKIVYILAAGLFFILPKSKFKNKKEYYTFALIMLLIIALPIFIWNTLTKDIVQTAIRTNQPEQIYFTLSDILRDLYTTGNTLYNNTEDYLYTMIGGWFTPYIVDFVFIAFLLFVTFQKDETQNDIKFSKKDKIIISVILLLIIALIFGGMYVGFTRAEYTIVEGVQGRYFIPILALILILFEGNRISLKLSYKKVIYFISLVVLYIPSLLTMVEYFNK